MAALPSAFTRLKALSPSHAHDPGGSDRVDQALSADAKQAGNAAFRGLFFSTAGT